MPAFYFFLFLFPLQRRTKSPLFSIHIFTISLVKYPNKCLVANFEQKIINYQWPEQYAIARTRTQYSVPSYTTSHSAFGVANPSALIIYLGVTWIWLEGGARKCTELALFALETLNLKYMHLLYTPKPLCARRTIRGLGVYNRCMYFKFRVSRPHSANSVHFLGKK